MTETESPCARVQLRACVVRLPASAQGALVPLAQRSDLRMVTRTEGRKQFTLRATFTSKYACDIYSTSVPKVFQKHTEK